MEEAPAWTDLVGERLEFLERLADEPAHKPALESDLDCSRSTIDRAIRRLESVGLVERADGGYVTTATGRLAARQYRAYVADQRAVEEARPLLEALPPDGAPPPAVLSGGRVETTEGSPGKAFERIARQLRTATTYRAVLPRVADSRHLRLLHARVVEDGMTAEVVVAGDLADRLREEFPGLTGDLLAAESCTLGRGEVPPYGLVIAADEEVTTALLATYDAGRLVGIVENRATPAVDRVEGTIDRHVADSAVIPEPTAGRRDGGTPVAAAGTDPGRALAEAGLTRVDRPYFTERTPGDPATAWRIGFDLAEVYYGYAVERTDPSLADTTAAPGATDGDGGAGRPGTAPADDGPEVADRLADRLASGEDHVVLGPPGAGKSTVCRQVACRWVKAGHGPVFYREAGSATGTGSGDGEGSLRGIADAVSPAEGRALVVVEDAAAPVTESFLSFLSAVRDDPSVAVLAEARESDWNGSVEAVADPELREMARGHLSNYELPTVDETTCRRALDAFEAATGRTVPLSPSELHDRVGNEGGLGEMHVLSHQVVAHATPWIDDGVERSALDGDVRATYDALIGDDGDLGDDPLETIPPAVGILVAALTAAEWPVTPGLVHSLAAAGWSGGERSDRAHRRVESAIDRLEGRMFVRRGDGHAYRTQHPQWAARFLEHALDRAERETVALFERAVNAVLALPDDPGRRERIEGWLGRDSPAVERFGDPDAVDEFVETLFGLGLDHADLAPLFGTTEHSGIDLPDACSVGAELEARSCRGKTWMDRGDRDRAEAELTALCDAAAAADCDGATRTTYLAEGNRLLAEAIDDRGETDRARERLERSLDAARRGDHPRHEIGALNSLAWVAMTVDDYDRARERLEAAIEVAEAEAIDDCIPHSTTLYYMAKLHLLRGDLATAEEWLSETVELDRELGNRRNVSYSLKTLGDVAKDRGDIDRAVDHYRRSLELKRQVGDRSGTASLLLDLGDLHLDRGEADRAESAFERSLAIAREDDMERHLGLAHGGLGRLALDRGDSERAADHFETQREIHDGLNHDRGVASATVGLGDVARQRGDLDRARDRYREGFERYRAIGDRLEAARALDDLVEACLEAGDEAAAAEWCETGVEHAADLDDWEGSFADCLDDLREEADAGG